MMGQQIKPNIKIQYLLDSSNQFYQDLLGYKPEQTSLQSVPENQWSQFSTQRGLNQNSSGIYLPRNKTAVIREQHYSLYTETQNSGTNPLSLFHEYFGHGLYSEQSLSGRKLVDLERKLLEKEKQEFQNRRFTLENIQKFRKQNKTFQALDEFRKKNLGQYETFAIWTEYLLSGEHNLRDEFGRKYQSLKRQEKEAVDSVINFSEQYGNLATFYANGLARRTSPKRVEGLLEELYGSEEVNNSMLVLLTGSKKPFSDIDLFASSNYLHSTKNNWLDLVVFDEEDFEKRVRLFETQVTHPIMSGEFVAGDKNYLQQKRKQLQEQQITEEAIRHNFEKAEKEKIASEKTNNEELKRVYFSYSKTYLANALALKQGLRLFTKENLLSYSQSEKLIQLKGGNKNNAT